MTLQPLTQSSWEIQLHVIALALAWVVGTWQFLVPRRGSAGHRVFGRVFIALMLIAASITLLIHVRSPHSSFFGLSLLHLYVPMIFLLCAIALVGARTRRPALHRFAVISMYFGSLIFTGLVQIFTASGITHRIFFH